MATSLTPLQIAQVRQIVGGGISLEATEKLLDKLSTEETTETLEDINDWLKVRKKTSKISGGRFGIETNKDETRLIIRNFVRERLGFPLAASFIDEEGGGNSYSVYTAPLNKCRE